MTHIRGNAMGRAGRKAADRPRGRARPRPSWRLPAFLIAVLALPTATVAQDVRVMGTVTSEDTGAPVVGVSVSVRGTAINTLTSRAGQYSLLVPSANDTLVFSFIGYGQVEEPIGGRSVVDVSLRVEAVQMRGLVVTGYGTQQRRDVTGSIARVDGADLTEVATPSVAQSLQGRVAGVQVTPASGEPGADAIIRIRGVGTLNQASPLYVVDGMLLDDVQFLAPEDVESVDVLKDASATAIYGSRGANGVIIITTKRGQPARATQFRLHSYAGTQRVLNPIDMVNARQYAELANELAANIGVAPYFPNPGAVGPGTDWQDEIFRTAPIQSHLVTAAGGSDRLTYYFSANLIEQEGVIDRSTYRRLTLRANNDYQLSDRLKLGHNLNFSHTDDQRMPGVLRALYYADPTVTPRNEAGEFSDANIRSTAGNPAATIFYTNNQGAGDRLVGNLFGELDFLAGFHFRSSFGLDYGRSDFRAFTPVFFVSPTQQNSESNIGVEWANTDSWLWENTLSFNRAWENHRMTVLGGITAQSFYSERLEGRRFNVAGENPNLWYLDAADADGQLNRNWATDWRMLSYLFRTNYTLMDRYLFTGSLRVDGSSRFGEENRYGWFPSLAAGWDMAQETFMQRMPAISALKLRGSWGQIGNDKIGAYPGIALIAGNLNTVFGNEPRFGAAPVDLANPQVRWEKTTQTNIGADAEFLNGRILATVDWYSRLTDGILVQVPIPIYVGVNSQPFVNAAEVLNTGVEGSLSWLGRLADFGIDLSVNGATINNEVKALGEGREEILSGGLGNEISFTTRTVVGQPIGSFWGFKIDGVFQNEEEIANSPTRGGEQPGDLKYVDIDGDGVITNADKTWLGSPIPDYIYGINLGVNWRAVDLGMGFSGQAGNKVFNGKKAVRFGVENFETSYLDRWRGEGTSDWEPRVTNAGHNYQASERFIEDGSFFKLHSAQLGFRVPQEWARLMRANAARIYLNGTNLFMITDYSGYTPELTAGSVIASGIDLGVFPPARTITVGIDLTF